MVLFFASRTMNLSISKCYVQELFPLHPKHLLYSFIRLQYINKTWTADFAPGVTTWEVTLSARKVVPCVR